MMAVTLTVNGRRRTVAAAPETALLYILRNDLELNAAKFGGGSPTFTRFERSRPNELWQMDFKGHVALRVGRLHPLTVLDDHSRFSVTLAACADEQTETVRQHLIAAFRRYGLPERLITDNGSPWGDGPGSPFTPLGVWLIEHGEITRPVRMALLLGRRPITERESTVLPEPDSPTMPSVRPRASVNETSSTACTMPAGVRNDVERLSTTSRRSALPSPTAPGSACPGSSPATGRSSVLAAPSGENRE